MSNSAARLYKILSRFNSANVSKISHRWGVALGIPEESQNEHDLSVALIAIREELIWMEGEMRRREIPQALWQPHLANIATMTKVQSLGLTVAADHHRVATDALVMLLWAGYVLGESDAEEMSAEARKQLKDLIDQLAKALLQAGIPTAFYEYASKALRELARAMELEPIKGVGPLRDAVRSAVSQATFEEDALKRDLADSANSPATENVRITLGAALKKAADVTGDAVKFGENYGRLLSAGQKVGEFISTLIDGGSPS